jgi:hypothetical protein
MALVATGAIVAVVATATPASGHVTSSVSHLIDHMKTVFYTKAQSNSRFLSSSKVLRSGRVTLSNFTNQTITKKTLINDGTFRFEAVCARNNVGSLQAEIWVYSTQDGSYADSFGNGTDGALSRSQEFGAGSTYPDFAILGVVPEGRFDSRSYTLLSPSGRSLTGTVMAGANIQGAHCVFTVTGIRN